MSGIFISYRRDDSEVEAQELRRRLSDVFGEDHVFIDVETIGPGDNFGEVIDEKVGFCDALLAVIGDRWTSITDQDGRRRLDDTRDWVRMEISSAFSRGILVIPVLVGQAQMPHPSELPKDIARLSALNAQPLRQDRSEQDFARLQATLEESANRGTAWLWLSILKRGHKALDPLDLHRRTALGRSLVFLAIMILIGDVLRLPVYTQQASIILFPAYVITSYIEWLAIGVILHFSMRALGGKGTLQKSVAAFCFLSAYVPLVTLAQVPAWGLPGQVFLNSQSIDWTPAIFVQHMQYVLRSLSPYGLFLLVLSWVVATVVWVLFLRSVIGAYRTLHRIGTTRVVLASILGLGLSLLFVQFYVIPLLGSVFGRSV